ncbi:MAG: ABC transporter ATP-binding protein [Bacteroidales bacterium]|nr:ABC transporter ATP-binding protein [Bacteroidales bacterium]
MNLTINNLSKTYSNGVQALDNVSLTIPNGLFGLLGPNGAGKSTLMRTIATLQEADNGEIWMDDLNVLEQKQELKQTLGYLPQEFGFYPKDRAFNLLDQLSMLKGIKDKLERKQLVEYILKKVNLWEARKQRIGTFSGGMKQRFGIAQALLGNPKLLIVDEPTAGLDPYERRRFHNLLAEIGKEKIVILSTHIVDDVSNLCTNMAIIDKGKILIQTDPGEIIKEFEGKVWEKDITGVNMEEFEKEYMVISTRLFAGKNIVRIYSNSDPGDDFKSVDPILEDVYFYTLSTRS